jgi:predicted hotdog family 3-hydroxylacyl-ACP dehydratase
MSYESRWDLKKKFDHHCADGSLSAWLSIHEASQSVGLYGGLDER